MTDFAQSALETLAEAARKAAEPLELVLHGGGSAPELGQQLADMALAIVEGTGGVVGLSDGDGVGPPELPALTIEVGDRQVAHYLAMPEGPEAPPFLDMLFGLVSPERGGSAQRRSIEGLDHPAELMVFIAPSCPHCPHAVQSALMLATANPQVSVSVIDAMAFSALAGRFGARSVPLTVIDGILSLTGVKTVSQLAQSILERGGEGHERDILQSMLDIGRFADAAERLADAGALEHFSQLWQRSSLELRIGLMLTAEEALENDPRSLDGMVPGLVAALEVDDRARRGDTADLLGKIGSDEARSVLEGLLEDPDPEVAEAAADALE